MEIHAYLKQKLPALPTERDFSFARHTTIGCGGTAALAAFPRSGAETARLLRELSAENIPYCFLGAGANVLPADGRFEGVVVRFSRMDALVRDGNTVLCGAGVTVGRLLRTARAYGLGGAEFLTGIPASLGGAVTMNAGVREGHIGDLVTGVLAVEHGVLREYLPAACDFGEKQSVFQRGAAVCAVWLKFSSLPQSEIDRRLFTFRAARAGLPKGRSMGCVFVNPAGRSAGEIIERCGLKGAAVGGASVSERHANFILNRGGTAADVAALIAHVRRTVFERTGILLREEIKRLPGST